MPFALRRLARLAALTGLAALLAACSGAPVGNAGRGFVAGAGGEVLAVEERRSAPDIRRETLDGQPLALEDLEGPVVVNFWASWCGPCATEQPHLVALAQEYGPRGVHFVGVNVKDTRANAQAFAANFSVPYPSWFDESASIAASFGGIGPAALPTTLVLDGQHRVAARFFGAVTAARLVGTLEQMLEEQAR